MPTGPSKSAEAIVGVLLPPACREEVLGDLYERFKTRWQYAADALATVPLVILSQIRRTADPQIVLIQGFAWYLSYSCAAWFRDRALLMDQWGLVRLAIPAAIALLALLLDDAYARPGRRSPLSIARGPVLAFVLALVSQGILWAGKSPLALPAWIAVYGCAMSLLLSSAVRMLFPPAAGQLLGANVPALWLKRGAMSDESPRVVALVLKSISAVVALAAACIWLATHTPPKPGLVILILLLVAVYQAARRV